MEFLFHKTDTRSRVKTHFILKSDKTATVKNQKLSVGKALVGHTFLNAKLAWFCGERIFSSEMLDILACYYYPKPNCIDIRYVIL